MKKNRKKKLVLFDAHAIIHRAYHALPDFMSHEGEPTGALYGLSTMLIKIIDEFQPDYMAACYDLPKPTYRHEAYEEYKSGRKEAEEDLKIQLERSKDIFKAFSIPIYSAEGFEADDILGTIVEQTKKEKDLDVVIASGDMDTLQLVGDKKVQVFTLKRGIQDTVLYDEEAVESRFGFGVDLLPDYKGLRGDPSDNIPGIAGIGEKTATELVINFGSIEDIYKTLEKDESGFEKRGIKKRIIKLLKENKEDAEFSKMLATIRKDAPIKFRLPSRVWRQEVDSEKITNLFSDLGFRRIVNRLKELLGEKTEQQSFNMINQDISEENKEDAKLMLWLLDSTKTNPSIDDVLHYTKTKDFKKALETLREGVEKNNLSFIYEKIEKPLLPVVKEMSQNGVLIDKKYMKDLSEKYRKELEKIEKDIFKDAGEEFNVNSPKQLGEILFEKMELKSGRVKKTATGQYSTKESELEKMRELHPVIEKILNYRELQKLLSTYIDTIPTMLDEKDRLHAEFIQTGTTTGRMSSNHPNLQNIPIKTELGRNIRNAFLARKNFSLASLDYSQIELRVAAILSKDEKLLNIFKNNRDVHTEVASEVFGVEPKDVDKEMRRRAKVINFGMLYGMGIVALQKNLGVERKEAQDFYDKYFSVYSTLGQFLESQKSKADRDGYTETLFGRRRYFPEIKSRLPYIRSSAERMAINAPIQGTSADIIKYAMVKIDEYLKKEKIKNEAYMILQIHDELVFEINDDKVEEISKEIQKIMQLVVPDDKKEGIPILTDIEIGKNWGEMKEI